MTSKGHKMTKEKYHKKAQKKNCTKLSQRDTKHLQKDTKLGQRYVTQLHTFTKL